MTTEPLWAAKQCQYPYRRFRYLFDRVDRPAAADAEIVTAYTDGRVTLRSNRRVDGYHEAASLDSFKGVAKGDFVVHGLDILRGSIGVSDSDGAISAVCTTCRPRPGVEPRFAAYALRAQAWSGYTRAFARGVREGGADFRRWSTLGDLYLPTPPAATQRLIADFLDSETARIETLVAKKQRMVQVLQERFSRLVSEATRADVLTGDANQLPTAGGWRRMQIRRCIASMDYGIGEATSPEGAFPVLGMGNIANRKVVGDTPGYVVTVDPYLLLAPGDLLFNRTNSLALVGKVGLYTGTQGKVTFASYLVRLRTNELAAPEYLNYVLNTDEVLAIARSNALPSIGQANLNPNRYASIHIPLPSRVEQERLVATLEHERASAETGMAWLSRQIELFAERRQALITSAVIGDLELPVVA